MTTSLSLLARARSQDPHAWERLVNMYAPVVYSWCRRAEIHPDDAADIAQEVLLTVFLKLDKFRKEEAEDTFRGWLRRVTANQITDFRRHAARRPPPAAGGGLEGEATRKLAPDGSDEPAEREIWALLEATQRVRRRCSERTWDIFTCYVMDNLSAKETSMAFGVSIGYVHQVRAKLLRRLRKELVNLRQTLPEEP